MKTAVDPIGSGKAGLVKAPFAAMVRHYLFEPEFCNPASGREKRQVEKNLQLRDWAGVFGDAKMITAPLDRLTHHCHILETWNDRFRFRASSAAPKLRKEKSPV